MPLHRTACPRNCYSTCSLIVQIEGGLVRAIETDPANRATGEGVCLKGLSYVERVHSPDRILHPLKRRPGGLGFDRIDWDEALDRIAGQLERFRDESGPQSILHYAGSGTKGILNGVAHDFWRIFGGCTTTYGDLCWPAGLEATRLTLGENKHSAPWDLENARLIVLWGKNPAETNVHQIPHIGRALDRGAQLIVVDPRRTQSAEGADLLLQPRPGTDGALALAVAGILIEQGWIDCGFIDRHVLGFEAFREAATAMTAEKAAAITDIPVPLIERFAEAIGSTAPMTINGGFGFQRYTNAGQTVRAVIALLALTGNIGRPGAGWVYANLQSHAFDAVKDPQASYPPDRPDGVIRVGLSVARFGRDLPVLRDPPVRMAWIERGNPATQNPETGAVLAALRGLEFRVVVDQFLTDTAREADIILPAKTFLEQTDVISAYWHPYIQLKRKAIDPPGEVKPETEIWYLLAKRLGLDDDAIAGAIPAPGDAAIDSYLAAKLEAVPGVTLDLLAEGPLLPPGHEEVAFADLGFATPSGKVELESHEAAERWDVDPLPLFREPVESARRRPPGTDRYPLCLLTPNTKDRIHSQFNNLELIRQVSPEPLVFLHPDDAAPRGIGRGDRVRVFNERGSFAVEARIDFSLKPGCVVVANGWWIAGGGGVNACSAGRETDMGHGAAFHDNCVEIERVP